VLKGLAGKTVLVTGASGGIGSATCYRLQEEKANVVAVDLDRKAMATAFDEKVVQVTADVSNAAGASAGVEAAEKHFGGLDLAFLNAGVECHAAPVANFSETDYDRVFDINVRGLFLCAQSVVNHLLTAGKPGGILFMSSIAGLQGSAYTSVYNASKHAVIGLAKSLALEVGGQNIRVNVLCPGGVDTRMMRSLEGSMGEASGVDADEMKKLIEAGSVLGRYAHADEIAALAAWILSDEAPYCHGETLTIGGGMMA
jgi:NAD(P)-dependent dehydrogenase (short-subunit alcohol dehydrogenase family)